VQVLFDGGVEPRADAHGLHAKGAALQGCIYRAHATLYALMTFTGWR
jgi:hypothetical protein